MMLTRRQFGKVTTTGALALGVGELTMGVSCESVFQDISTYVPAGIEAFDVALELLDPTLLAALQPAISAVKNGLADLAADVEAYENAPAASKATLVGKITTIINIIIGNIQQFWADLNLPDGALATTIENILQVILSVLSSFLPLIGGSLTYVNKKSLRYIPFTPEKRSKKQFKAAVNVVLSAHGYAQRIY
jgi:hypothetical protein